MDPSFSKSKQKNIPIREAANRFGYSTGYLSNLCRTGKIVGTYSHNEWSVDTASLESFIKGQAERKEARARSLAHNRSLKYREHNLLPKPTIVPKLLGIAIPIRNLVSNGASSSVRGQALALSVATVVLVSAALVAQAAVIPQLAHHVATIASDIAFGFNETFGDIPSHIAEKISAVDGAMRTEPARIAIANEISTSNIAPLDFSSVQLPSFENSFATHQLGSPTSKLPTNAPTNTPVFTVETLQSFARNAYANLTSPSLALNTFAHAYVAIGIDAYAAINTSFAAYHSLIEKSGAPTLALAATTRDTYLLALAPLPTRFVMGFGTAIIDATHALIHADVATSYGLAVAAPASARATVALVGSVGDVLALATSRAPVVAQTLYLRATAAPSLFAPAIAQTVFDAEYAMATHFVPLTHTATDKYLALVWGTGRLAYVGAKGTRDSINATGPFLASTPLAFEEAYLGVLGKSALALDTLARVPKVAAVLSAVNTVTAPMLAAVASKLSVGEQIALATYETIRNFINATGSALAFLFGPLPTVVIPSGIPPQHITTNATSTRTTVSSYPTYTTVVQGVSQDFLNKSLVSLRTDILSTVAGMIQPIATQTALNLINMYSESHPVVFTGLPLVSATVGNFGSLNAGTTNLGNTTVTGDLTVSGTITPAIISAGSFISAPYFALSSTTATSTIAGNLSVTGNINLNGALLQNNAPFISSQWTTSGSNLYYTTGKVGIGTTSPWGQLSASSTSAYPTLAIEQKGSGPAAIFLGGNVGIGTTTPSSKLEVNGDIRITGSSNGKIYFSDGTFMNSAGVGTASALLSISDAAITADSDANGSGDIVIKIGAIDRLHILNSNGFVGISTSSPSVALDIANGKSGINIWAATGANYKKANLGYSDAVAADVFTISTNAPGGGTYQDIQIVPNGGGGNTGLYLNTSGQAGIGYTSFADPSIGNALLVNGRIGIGTTTPTNKFTVVANGRATGDLRYALQIVNSDSATTQATNLAFEGQGGSAGNKWIIGTDVNQNNTNAFFIATSTGPGVIAPFTITSDGAIKLGNTTGVVSGNALYAQNGGLFWDGTQLNGAGISNYWSNSGGSTYLSTITDNLGIGTTSPYAKLSVAGNIVMDSFNATSTTATSTIAGNLWVKGAVKIGNSSLYLDSNGISNSAGTYAIDFTNGSTTLSSFNSSGQTILAGLSGNVGIGTSTPASILDIYGTDAIHIPVGTTAQRPAMTLTGQVRYNTTTHQFEGYSDSGVWNGLGGVINPALTTSITAGVDDFLRFITASTERMTVMNTGNVGVGDTNPASKLTVNGDIRIKAGSGGTFYFSDGTSMSSAGVGSAGAVLSATNATITADSGSLGTGDVILKTGATDRLHILNNGNVGISNTSPTYRLSVFSTDATTNLFQVATTTQAGVFVVNANGYVGVGTSTPAQQLSVAGKIYTTGGIQFPDGSLQTAAAAGAAAGLQGQVGFYNVNGSTITGTSTIFIAPSGNVGIGTTVPGVYKLNVAGNTQIGWLAGTGPTATLRNMSYGSGESAGTNSLLFAWANSDALKIEAYKESDRTGGFKFYTETNFDTAAVAMTIKSNGNVGIGTMGPAYKLSISGTGGVRNEIIGTDAGSTAGLFLRSNGNVGGSTIRDNNKDLEFFTSTTGQVVTIKDTGNVGIGLTNPGYKLDVAGDVHISGSLTCGVSCGGAGGATQWTTNGSAIYYNAGNVGIGTTNPASANGSVGKVLELATGANTASWFVSSASGTSGSTIGGGLEVRSTASVTGDTRLGQFGIVRVADVTSGKLSSQMGLYVNNDGTLTNAVTIQPNGNVGIGTTTPSEQLNLTANQRFTSAGSAIYALPVSGFVTSLDLAAGGPSAFNNGAGIRVQSSGAGADGTISFTTNQSGVGNAERMRITNVGNVGIGTTTPNAKLNIGPSTTSSNQLQLTGDASTAFTHLGSYGNNTYLFNNYYYNAGHHSDDATASSTGIVMASTYIALQYAAPSATPSRVTGLLMDTMGNVGIGTTTPTRLLTVNGTGANQGFQVTSALGTRLNYIGGLGSVGAAAEQGYFELRDNATPKIVLNSGGDSYINGGNFGIGTTSPTAKLEVASGDIYIHSPTTDYLFIGESATLMGQFGWDAVNNKMLIQTSGYTSPILVNNGSLTILGGNGNGNVGIGTTNPTSKLEVNGDIKITAASGGKLIFADGTFLSSSAGGAGAGITSWNSLNFQTGGAIGFQTGNGTATTTQMTVLNNGNVGIGTASPTQILTVVKNSNADNIAVISNSDAGAAADAQWRATNGTANTGLAMLGTGFTPTGMYKANGAYLYATGAGGLTLNMEAAQPIYFGTNNTERMRIDSSGNVGIGTTNPLARLYVAAASGAVDVASFTTNDWVVASIGSNLTFGFGAASGNTYSTIRAEATGHNTNANLVFQPTGGNVGIGTTNPAARLDLGMGTGGKLFWYDDSTTGPYYGTKGGIYLDQFSLSNNTTMVFSTGAVNPGTMMFASKETTVNDASSLTTRMTIQGQTGNVGIGTTNPGYKLDVNGAVNATSVLINGVAVGAGGTQWASGTGGVISYTGGNVGIGTAIPNGGNLHVAGSSSRILVQSTNAGGNTGYRLEALSPNSTNRFAGMYLVPGDTDATTYLGLTADDSNFQIVATRAGNVGIGTTTPQWNLQVAGTRPSFALTDTSAAANQKHWLFSSMGGNLYIGTSTDAYATSSPAAFSISNAGNITVAGNLTVNGAITGAGTFTATTSAPYFAASSRGAAAAPAFTFSSDLTTGLWSPSANMLALSTGGAERVRVDANGYVGIGVTAPAAMLDVSAPNTVNALRLGNATNANATMLTVGTTANNPNLSMYNASGVLTNYLTTSGASYLNGGSVGIGTTSPWGQLSASSTSAFPTLAIEQKGAGAAATFLGGNVGIGTTSPGTTLDVQGSARVGGSPGVNGYTSLSVVSRAPAGQGYGPRLVLTNTNGADAVFTMADTGSGTSYYTENGYSTWSTATGYGIKINTNGTDNNGIRILTNGNVGIGTAGPGTTLDVTGSNVTATIRGVNTASTGGSFVGVWGKSSYGPGVEGDGLGASYYGVLGTNMGSAGSAVNGQYSGTGTGVIGQASGAGIGGYFSAGSGGYAIIVPSGGGNVGIGTTNPGAKLEVSRTLANNDWNALTISNSGSWSVTPNKYAEMLFTDGTNNIAGIGATFTGAYGRLDFNALYNGGSGSTATVAMSILGNGTVSIPNVANCNPIKADASGTLNCSSDERLKDISGAYTTGLAAIDAINPILYTWKAGSGLTSSSTILGFSAQNVQSVIPEAVTVDSHGFLQLDQESVLAAAVNAIKELNTKVDTLAASSTIGQYVVNNYFSTSTPTYTYITSTSTPTALAGSVTGSLIPNTDNAYALGSPTNRFSDIYAKNINAGDLTFTETTSAVSGNTLQPGDTIGLFVTSTAGSTHTVPIDFRTAINTTSYGANNVYFNTAGKFGIGVSSTTALRGKLDVEGAITAGSDSRLLTLANTSSPAALPYSLYIPGGTGSLTLASNDNSLGSTVNSSYPVWQLSLNGEADSFSINHAPAAAGITATNFFQVTNTGKVGIGSSTPSSLLSVGGSGYFSGNITTTNLVATGTLAVSGATTFSSATAFNSTATTTFGGSIASASGNFTIGSAGTTNNILLNPYGGNVGIGTSTPASILDIYGTDALHLPVGTSAQRPTMALTGQVRYNSQTHQFEGYSDTGVWNGLGGVINPAQTTYITAGTDDFLRFVTASAEQMTVMNTGNVGIGDTNPASKLTVNGDIRIKAGSGGTFYFSDGTFMTTAGVGTASAVLSATDATITGDSDLNGSGDIVFKTGVTDRFHILNNGNIGISNTSPAYRLSVFSTDATTNLFQVSTTTQAGVFVVNANGYVGIGSSTPAQQLSVAGKIYTTGGIQFPDGSLQTAAAAGAAAGLQGQVGFYNVNGSTISGTSTIFIAPSGNVGIGTTNPTAALMIERPINTESSIRISKQAQAYGLIGFPGAGTTMYMSNISSGYALGSPEISLALTSNGNVGIGTTGIVTPNAKLQVIAASGNIYPLTLTTNDYVYGSAGSRLTFNFGAASGNTYSELGAISNGGSAWNNLVLQSGGGNVGIGTTNPGYKLDVNGDVHVSGSITCGVSCGGAGGATQWTTSGSIIYYNGGNVGIGTAAPAAKLHISGGDTTDWVRIETTAAGTGGFLDLYSSGTGGFIPGTVGINTQGPLVFATASLERMRITAAGNVGVGTTSPYSLLSISNSATTPANTPLFTIASTSGGTSTSTLMTVLANGNVGIGTTNPGTALWVVGTSTATTLSLGGTAQTIDPTVGSHAGMIVINDAANNAYGIGLSAARSGLYDMYFQTGAANGGGYRWYTGGTNERMTMTNGGNVGIGTTTPAQKLDVYGATGNVAISVTAGAASNSGALLQVLTDATTRVVLNDATASGKRFDLFTGGSQYGSSFTGKFGIADAVISAVRLTIDGSGNVGIGTTTPSNLLQVNSGATPATSQLKVTANGAGSLSLLSYAVDNQQISFDTDYSSAGWVARSTSAAWIYKSAGFLNFRGSTGNTIGGIAAGTDRMTIDLSNGNVGIGTTNPTSKLEVNGDIKITTASGGKLIFADGTFLSSSAGGAGAGITSWNSLNFQTGGAIGFQTGNGTATTTQMTVLNNGNVGIGTTNPGVNLDVVGTGSTYARLTRSANSSDVQFIAKPAGALSVSNPQYTFGINLNTSYGTIGHYDGTTGFSDIVISTTGNVGIGTTTPRSNLDVTGTGLTAFTGVTNGLLRINSSANAYSALDFAGIAAGPINTVARISSDITGSGSLLQFGTSNNYASGITNTAMTIDYNGSVGIGTTTTGGYALYVQNSGVAWATTLLLKNTVDALASRAGLTIENNGGKQTFLYKQATGNPTDANDTILYAAEGDIRFFAGTGESMRLKNGGNVTIGAPADTTTYKVNVNGSLNATSVYSNGVLLSPGTGSNWTVSGGNIYRSAGLVGIGTASPSQLLDVRNSQNGFTISAIQNAGTGTLSRVGLVVGEDYVQKNVILQYFNNSWAAVGGQEADRANGAQLLTNVQATGGLDINVEANAPLTFTIGGLAAANERMRITGTGNVGIGTTSPFAKFAIAGAAGAGTNLFAISTSTAGYATSTAVTVDQNGNLSLLNGANLTVTGTINGTISGVITSTATTSAPYFAASSRGAATAPAFTFSGDLTTGLWSPSANMLALSTGGAERVRVDTNGYVGIGVTAPTAMVDISSPNTVNAFRLGNATNGSATMLTVGNASNNTNLSMYNSAGTLTNYLTTSGTSYLNGGNVGMGTTSPYAVMSISNSATTPANTPLFAIASTTTTGTATLMTVLTNGNVGIGTTNPGYKLDVNSGSAWNTTHTYASFGSLNQDRHLVFGQYYTGSDSYSYIQARYGTGDSTVYPLLINPYGGNVGIGTTSPGYKLDVQGVDTSGGLANFQVTDAANKPVLKIQQLNAGGNPGDNQGLYINVIGAPTGRALTVLNNTTTNFVIQNNGNVGIGTTGPNVKLDVVSTSNDNSDIFRITNNGQYLGFSRINATGAWSIQGNQVGNNNIVLAPTSGNVGIGTASPVSNLTVKGISLFAPSGVFNGIQNAVAVEAQAQSTGWSALNAINITDTAYTVNVLNQGTSGNNAFIGFNTEGGIGTLRGSITYNRGGGLVAYNTTSDARLKNILGDASSQLAVDRLSQIQVRNYEWKETPGVSHVGFIAQELYQVNPEAVTVGGVDPAKNPWQIDRSALIPDLVLGFQALDARTSFITAAATSTVLTVDVSGNVGVGTPTPQHTLDVAGDIGAISFVNTSTRSLKTDISYATASSTDQMLNELVNLRVATYRYKIEDQSDPLRIGLIAEDTAAIAPEILSPDGKGIDLYKLATFTLSGVQALAARVDSQNMRLTSLESRVTALENGAVSSATGSPLTLSTTSLASAFNAFGVFIQKGIAQFNTLVFQRLVAATDSTGASSAGSVTILTGNTVAQVYNSLVSPSTKVFITFNSQITGSWWVSDKAAGSFRVVLSAPQAGDVSFDYFLVQTQGQIATSTPDTNLGVELPSGTVSQSGSSGSSGTTAPTITLLGDNPMHISVGGTFVEPGVSVSNGAPYTTFVNGIQQETNATTINTASATTYTITYYVYNGATLLTSAGRSVIVGNPDSPITTGTTPVSTDMTAPVVTLTGAAAMQLTVSDTLTIFTDPGATATDDTDGDLTSKIIVTGAVNAATVGSYTLTYTATDKAGNIGTASRLVTILAGTTTTSTTSSTPTPDSSPTSTTPTTSTSSSTPAQ